MPINVLGDDEYLLRQNSRTQIRLILSPFFVFTPLELIYYALVTQEQTSQLVVKMKIETVANNSSSFQRKLIVTSSLEDEFAKLTVDVNSTEPLESKLKDLNLDDKSKLIERGPITTKALKLPENKPYKKVTENVYVRHNCGGAAFSITDIPQQNYDSIGSSTHNYFEANNYRPPCSECQHFFDCDRCILQLAYSPEFIQHITELDNIEQHEATQEHSLQQTQTNVTNISHTLTSQSISESTTTKTYPEFIKLSVRRISGDSGFQSDSPSPRSDYVLSPNPSFVLQPSKFESVTSFRKILPKNKETQKIEENITKITPKMSHNQTKENKKINATEKSAKELLRSTLNPEIKQVKWIELVVKKSDDELFETGNSEETILHKLLQSEDKHIAESLYAITEKMKMNPDRCLHIIAAKSSICDTIKQNKHPQLWLDYFCEAVQIIQQKIGRNQSKN